MKSLETAKSVNFVKEPAPSLLSSVNGVREKTGQDIDPTQITSASETQPHQPKSKDVLPEVSTEEYLKRKEERRAERKRQVQLRLEYQIEELKIEHERRTRETDEQLRQLEEQKTFEMWKLKNNTDTFHIFLPQFYRYGFSSVRPRYSLINQLLLFFSTLSQLQKCIKIHNMLENLNKL